MEDVLVGLVLLLVGISVAFMGLRLWFVMLPIWGFFAGFFVGAIAITSVFGDGFLSTVVGWVVGIVVGLVFAAISYLWWYIGAMVTAGSVGAMVGAGLLQLFGADAEWLLFLAGAIGAAVFVFVAFVTALPVWVVVVNTAIAGAAGAVLGAMLIFDQVDVETLSLDALGDSALWIIAVAVVAVLGVMSQLDAIRRIVLPEARLARAGQTIA